MNGYKALISQQPSGYTAVEYYINPIIGRRVLKTGSITIGCEYGGITRPGCHYTTPDFEKESDRIGNPKWE